jgi:hypothetical protein
LWFLRVMGWWWGDTNSKIWDRKLGSPTRDLAGSRDHPMLLHSHFRIDPILIYFQAAKNLEFYGKVALSDRTAQIDDGTNVSTHTFLYQGRTQLRLSRAFDAAAEFRFITQPVTDVQRWSLGNEVGYWIMPDVRVAVGYNYKSIDEYRADFLANPFAVASTL